MLKCLSLWNVIYKAVALVDVQLKLQNVIFIFFKDPTHKMVDLDLSQKHYCNLQRF